MARVGRFGRNRRLGSSNLTQLIANLMREQRQAEDRAAFDAWQNGGKFKGQDMTDGRILEYIKGRRDMMSKDDPLWDEWNNTLIQTKFSIGEQKVGLAFKQGKMSAGAVAGWYRRQLDDIPKSSAFYREVAGRAADWAKSAAGSARAAGAARATAAAKAKYERLKGVIGRGERLTAAIEAEAKRRGVLDRDGHIWDVDASNLEAMFQQGVTLNGQTVTMGDWQRSSVRAYNANTQMKSVYKTFGWDTSSLLSNQQTALQKLTIINALDDRSKYETARDLWAERIANAQGDPYAIEEINADYAKTLGGILDSAKKPGGADLNEDAFIGGLINEINALGGKVTGPTVAEQYDIERNDAETTAQSIANNAVNAQALRDGTAYYGQKEAGGAFEVIADPLGMAAKDPAIQRTVVSINGNMRDVYLRGEPVRGAVIVSSAGSVLPNGAGGNVQTLLDSGQFAVEPSDTVVGYVFRDPGGKVNYGVYQNGKLVFTSEDPFGQLTAGTGNDGFLALGTGTLDEKGNTVLDPTTVFRPNLGAAAMTSMILSTGMGPNTLRAYLLGTGDPNDALLAEELGGESPDASRLSPDSYDRRYATPATPTSSNVYDSLAAPAGAGASVVQSAVSAVLSNIQSGLGPLFSPSPSSPPRGTVPPASTPSAPPPRGTVPAPKPEPPKPEPPKPAPKPAPFNTPRLTPPPPSQPGWSSYSSVPVRSGSDGGTGRLENI